MTTSWRERLEAKATNWQTPGERLFLPVEDALTILHEARRAAFEACALLADVHANARTAIGLDFRALAAKEGET